MLEFIPMSLLAPRILMVRPAAFGYNPETAETNAFQQKLELSPSEISRLARAEFDLMTARLIELGVDVVVLEDDEQTTTPDAVFPNNWFSTHPDGTFCLYPMKAKARRMERGLSASVRSHLNVSRTVDLTFFEQEGMYLEGTGSLVLDHENSIAFVCRSSRSALNVLERWCGEMEYEANVFDACDIEGKEIYHTNVMMCLGTGFAVACIESIKDSTERANFIEQIHQTERELIEISYEQMNSFAGNMLEIAKKDGGKLLVMSETAQRSLSHKQIEKLQSFTTPVAFNIDTIEKCGGGSVRCMIAEMF